MVADAEQRVWVAIVYWKTDERPPYMIASGPYARAVLEGVLADIQGGAKRFPHLGSVPTMVCVFNRPPDTEALLAKTRANEPWGKEDGVLEVVEFNVKGLD